MKEGNAKFGNHGDRQDIRRKKSDFFETAELARIFLESFHKIRNFAVVGGILEGKNPKFEIAEVGRICKELIQTLKSKRWSGYIKTEMRNLKSRRLARF